MSAPTDNGIRLRMIIEESSLTQAFALSLFNEGQARPMGESQWKAYLANLDSKRRYKCPDWVVDHMAAVAGKYASRHKK